MKKLARIFFLLVFTLSVSIGVYAQTDPISQTSENTLSTPTVQNSETSKEAIIPKLPETGLFKTDTIEFDGNPVEFSTILYKDRIYLKLRDLCYNLKCNVEVDNELRIINILKNPDSVQDNVYADKEKVLDPIKVNIDISNFIIKSDGMNTYMESIIYQGRTYVPVRFFSEVFEKKVDWLADQRKVTVSTIPPVIIGYVNGQALYKKDFDFFYDPQYINLINTTTQTPSENDIKNLKSATFDTLVLYTLLLQKAAKENIILDENDYEQANSTINTYILINDGIENFRSILEENKITLYQYSNNLRDTILIDKMANELVKDVTPSEETIQKYYEDNTFMFVEYEQVRAKHILFSISDQTGTQFDELKKAEIKKKAEEVLAQIKAGANFDELMNKYTEDPGTVSYPEGYTFTRGQMVQAFEDTSFSMDVGEISDLVETPYGYHIIKLEEKIPEKQQTLDEARKSIIIALSPQEKQSYFDNIVEQLEVESIIVNNME